MLQLRLFCRSVFAALAVMVLFSSSASAQNSMFPKGGMPKGVNINQLLSQFGGMSGLSGGTGSLGGMSGGMGGMSSGLGGMSGGLGGAGGLGGGGVSGNNFGGVKAGSNFGANTGMGLGGQGQGNFIGRNANQFVGMNAMTGANMQNSGQQNFGNRGGMNLNNLQNFNQNGGQQQLVPIRAQQRIAFDYPKVAAPAVQTQVQVRFHKLTAKFPAMRGITFAADEAGVVVLSGEVKSASAAKLAEKLVRLEPGVKSVRSELTYPTE